MPSQEAFTTRSMRTWRRSCGSSAHAAFAFEDCRPIVIAERGYTDEMPRFEELESCAELTAEQAADAASSQLRMRKFLEWAAATARPDEGAPKVLLAIGALGEADWVEGALYVDIAGDDAVTKLSIFADYGFGIRERLLPLARLPVPFDEFVRAVRLAPKLIAPFKAEQLAGSLVLTPPQGQAADNSREDSLHSIAIAESSMTSDAVTKPPPPPASTPTPPTTPDQSGIHTHPTVRRMVAVKPEAYRRRNDD